MGVLDSAGIEAAVGVCGIRRPGRSRYCCDVLGVHKGSGRSESAQSVRLEMSRGVRGAFDRVGNDETSSVCEHDRCRVLVMEIKCVTAFLCPWHVLRSGSPGPHDSIFCSTY
jgi:hypothetical protein